MYYIDFVAYSAILLMETVYFKDMNDGLLIRSIWAHNVLLSDESNVMFECGRMKKYTACKIWNAHRLFLSTKLDLLLLILLRNVPKITNR